MSGGLGNDGGCDGNEEETLVWSIESDQRKRIAGKGETLQRRVHKGDKWRARREQDERKGEMVRKKLGGNGRINEQDTNEDNMQKVKNEGRKWEAIERRKAKENLLKV